MTLTRDAMRTTVLDCLEEIAPGSGAAGLAPDADLRVELDLDSMDVFDLVAALAERTGVDIPDREVAGLTTLEALVDRLLIDDTD